MGVMRVKMIDHAPGIEEMLFSWIGAVSQFMGASVSMALRPGNSFATVLFWIFFPPIMLMFVAFAHLLRSYGTIPIFLEQVISNSVPPILETAISLAMTWKGRVITQRLNIDHKPASDARASS